VQASLDDNDTYERGARRSWLSVATLVLLWLLALPLATIVLQKALTGG
jgi:hypothetical protein